jgi:hypothetical protein
VNTHIASKCKGESKCYFAPLPSGRELATSFLHWLAFCGPGQLSEPCDCTGPLLPEDRPCGAATALVSPWASLLYQAPWRATDRATYQRGHHQLDIRVFVKLLSLSSTLFVYFMESIICRTGRASDTFIPSPPPARQPSSTVATLVFDISCGVTTSTKQNDDAMSGPWLTPLAPRHRLPLTAQVSCGELSIGHGPH